MITSVKFPKKGKGYIYDKPENPGKAPSKESYEYWDWEFGRGSDGKRVFRDEKYNRDYERWAADKKYYDENKGKFINPAAKHLVGRTFEFQPGKLNIIFGPNGCGKTTILKAIAGTAGIAGDGMTKPADPSNVFGWCEVKEYGIEKVAGYIETLKQNSAEVDWDGNVVYYDNFAHTMKMGYSEIGMLGGTALGSFEDEITFRFSENRTNAGRKAMWLLGNVLEYQKKGITIEKIFEPYLNNKRANSTWSSSYKTQAEYYKQYENYNKEVPMTILFDEPEVNFDIMTVWNLYHNAFPTICEKMGTQIITVSHSPIVMCDDIINNEHINLISLDENYTKSVKGLLQTMQF